MRKVQVQISVNKKDAEDYYKIVSEYKEHGKLPACLFSEMIQAWKDKFKGESLV